MYAHTLFTGIDDSAKLPIEIHEYNMKTFLAWEINLKYNQVTLFTTNTVIIMPTTTKKKKTFYKAAVAHMMKINFLKLQLQLI